MKKVIFTIYLLLIYHILASFSLYADSHKVNSLKFDFYQKHKKKNLNISENDFLNAITYKKPLFINSGVYKSNKHHLKSLKLYKKQLINEISFKKSYKAIEKYSVGFF